jgi:hypothetical protein
VYWSGILYVQPFYELTDQWSEEEILNHFIHYHAYVEDATIKFQYNTKSPLNDFLLKYKEDGFGWNVPSSIDTCFKKAAERCLHLLKINEGGDDDEIF